MAIFRRKPNLRALARSGDVAGLVEASAFVEEVATPDGSTRDLGAPIRDGALRALADLGPGHGSEAVVRALHDPANSVRMTAVRILYQREDAQALAEAAGKLPRRGHSRDLALRGVLELDQPGTASPLAKGLVYQPGDELLAENEMQALESLWSADDQEAERSEIAGLLIDALIDRRRSVPDRAVQLLVRLAPDSVQPLIREVSHGRAAGRAVRALGQIGDVRALEPLVGMLEDDDSEVRAEACAALGELRDPAAVESLLRATRDPVQAVRAQAGAALDLMGTAGVVVGISALVGQTVTQALNGGGPADSNGKGLNSIGPAPAQRQAEEVDTVRRELEQRLAKQSEEQIEAHRNSERLLTELRKAESRLKEANARTARAEQRVADLSQTLSQTRSQTRSHPDQPADPAPVSTHQAEVPAADPAETVPREPVNLNTADFESLRQLGMSVTQTNRVLAYRERFHGYDSIDDLDEVPGIPGDLLGKLKVKLAV